MKMNGGQMVCESLLREGVDVIFGLPGGAILPLYQTLPEFPGLRHILVRHEQGAAHAADGYARATGRPGVCWATSGPGATNLVTGIATAQMDSIPMVAITGQVGRAAIGSDAFQETDITGITLPITKHNYLVMTAEEIPSVIREAFHIASTGRPGPVLVDIPKDVFTEEAEFVYPDTPRNDQLQAQPCAPRGTGQKGRKAPQGSQAARHHRRTRRDPGARLRRAARVCRKDADPRDHHAHGRKLLSHQPRALRRLARNATAWPTRASP